MPRKPALLLSLLNLVLKPIAGQTSASSNQLVVFPPYPPAHDREAWRAYWITQGQPWRTEPEIDEKRQQELSKRRCIIADTEKGIYPFKGVQFSRADIEWLLSTHENGRGPIDWSDERQRDREGLDLRGVDLRQADLRDLPLARLLGGLRRGKWSQITLEQRIVAELYLTGANLSSAHLEGADLSRVHLEHANLYKTHLEKADLYRSHLEGAYLNGANLSGASLRYAFFDSASHFSKIMLESKECSSVSLAEVHWSDMNLSAVNWAQLKKLGDEYEAHQAQKWDGRVKTKEQWLDGYHLAVRANRQLAVALQNQGLNEEATCFAYRAQVLQKRVWWFQMTQRDVKLRHRGQALGAWLFSWFLFLISGYGYRLWRSFLAYTLVIIGFTTIYYVLGASFKPPLSLVNALGLSMTSFHGRGFFPGVTQLNDTLTILASIEAFVGLILEATFIATLTQRFFGK